MTSWEASKRWYSWINNNTLNLPVQIMGAIMHYMNPLHIYCRMRDMGIAKDTAMFLCRIYESCIFKHFLTGSLAVLRRGEGRQRPHKIDRHGSKTLAVILLIVSLSILDAIFTLDLVSHGAVELNPVMAYYLNHGPLVFFGVKYFLTCASIVLILLIRDITKAKLKAKILFVLFMIPFALVVLWELYLVFSLNK
jgi:hypothetical protein